MLTNESIFRNLRATKNWTGGIKSYERADWAGVVYLVRRRLEELKKRSLQGLNDNCMSLVFFKDMLSAAQKDEISYFVWIRRDNPPIVFTVGGNQDPTIFHIGYGIDTEDPTMTKYRPGMKMPIPIEDLNKAKYSHPLLEGEILRIDCRPKPTGGPGHYFFYKLPRDLRVCCPIFNE